MIKRTLYFSQPVYLSLRNAQLVMKLPEVEKNAGSLGDTILQQSVRTFPIEDLGMVVLDNKQITITHGALAALVDNNCTIITCNEKSLPTGLLLPLEGNTLQQERFTVQIEASLPLKKQLWAQTTRQKILNQASILKEFTYAETGCMLAWADEVKSGDSNNLEARAAAYYWKNVFHLELPFFGRDREGDPPNNLLNYGYAILRAVMARALASSGLLVTLGIHHHNRYNAYALADDIMEPYRPYVDSLVLDIVRSGKDYTTLTKELKGQLLTIPTLDVMIDGKRSPLMVATSTTASSLVNCFSGETRKLIYPERNV